MQLRAPLDASLFFVYASSGQVGLENKIVFLWMTIVVAGATIASKREDMDN